MRWGDRPGGRDRPRVQRTTHFDVTTGPDGIVSISAVGRDIRWDSALLVDDEAALEVDVAPDRSVRRLELSPVAALASSLVGTPAGRGFRARVEQVLPEARSTVAGQLLDDVPAAVLISGYSVVRGLTARGVPPGRVVPPSIADRQSGECSGWRESGVMIQSIRSGSGVPLQDCPPAPDRASDPALWHEIGPIRPGVLRRHRAIEIRRSGEREAGLEIDAMFRDTHGEPDGAEVVLHEYQVTLGVVNGRVTSIDATPRVLPFPECPAAATEASSLDGMPIGELPDRVRPTLTGIRGCTHLNDLLRALGAIPELTARLEAEERI